MADGVEAARPVQSGRHLDAVLTRLLAEADATGELDWAVSVDSTVVRAHQHGATAKRTAVGVDRENLAHVPGADEGALRSTRIRLIRAANQDITGSGGPAEGSAPRATRWSTGAAGRW